MLTDIELLGYIRETAQMGHDGIDSVMKYASCRPLSDALRQQKAEYGEICSAATSLIKARGGNPEPLPMGSRMGLKMDMLSQRMSPPSTSKIAAKMITGNTKGVIKSMQRRRQYLGRDQEVKELSQKLLETEQNNIEQMKPFL